MRLVAVGASWGGLDAMRSLLHGLPADLAAAVVVAQHRSPESHRNAYRELLAAATRLRVCEAGDKDELREATVFLAPPDYHLLVDSDRLELSTDEPVSYARPSIDVLFESAADAFRERCIGVVLTGANADGAHGLSRIVAHGGVGIVQDPATAERDEMPLAAIAAAPEATVAPLAAIPALILGLCGHLEEAA